MADINLLIILGTKRESRTSEHAWRYIIERAQKRPGVEVVTADPRDFLGALPNISDPKFHELVEAADAFIIVTPEYNRGYPGDLKTLLDSEYDAYYRKPVALVGVSEGIYGGRHVVEHLLPTLRTIGMVPIRGDVLVGESKTFFDVSGKPMDNRYDKAIEKQLDELLWYARALRAARKESENDTTD